MVRINHEINNVCDLTVALIYEWNAILNEVIKAIHHVHVV